jgi:hypothetical protein
VRVLILRAPSLLLLVPVTLSSHLSALANPGPIRVYLDLLSQNATSLQQWLSRLHTLRLTMVTRCRRSASVCGKSTMILARILYTMPSKLDTGCSTELAVCTTSPAYNHYVQSFFNKNKVAKHRSYCHRDRDFGHVSRRPGVKPNYRWLRSSKLAPWIRTDRMDTARMTADALL